jgi:hypothetical protein
MQRGPRVKFLLGVGERRQAAGDAQLVITFYLLTQELSICTLSQSYVSMLLYTKIVNTCPAEILHIDIHVQEIMFSNY